MKAIKSRIKAIWWLLTRPNFIVIIPKETTTNGQPSREIEFVVRTDYTLNSDLLSIVAVGHEINRVILQKAEYQTLNAKMHGHEIHN